MSFEHQKTISITSAHQDLLVQVLKLAQRIHELELDLTDDEAVEQQYSISYRQLQNLNLFRNEPYTVCCDGRLYQVWCIDGGLQYLEIKDTELKAIV